MMTSVETILEAYNESNSLFMGKENENVAKAIFKKMDWSDNQEATADEIADFLHDVDTYRSLLYGEDTIVLFHVGRGGIFYNPGHLEYKGIGTINVLIGELFLNEDGEFYAENGKLVGLTEKEVNTGVGSVDFDGEYDTWYSKKMIDLDDRELELVLDDEKKLDDKVAILIASGMDKQQALCTIIENEL